jgi:hypothetical protein
MNFPKDHFPHPVAVEWWYIWFKIGDKYGHHCLFKNSIGVERRLWLHCSFDGEFNDYDEFQLEENGYTTGFDGNDFIFSNNFLNASLLPLCVPIVHKDKTTEAYYSIPFMEGKTKENISIEGWFDHEWCNFPDKVNGHHKLRWDWYGMKYNDGYFRLRANGRYDIEGDEYDISDGIKTRGKFEYPSDEVIFTPRFGPKYSEQPFIIVDDGKQIGTGMRERTYGRS